MRRMAQAAVLKELFIKIRNWTLCNNLHFNLIQTYTYAWSEV